MEFILELLLIFVVRFLGFNTRYYFLQLFDKSVKRKDLSGDADDFGNDLLNAIVGVIVFAFFFYLIAKIFY